MFLENHFTEEYYSIIKHHQDKTSGFSIRQIKKEFGYTEKHHIIPRSLNGTDTKDNIVYITASDHFRCHKLLVQMTSGEARGKMWNALWRMMNKQSRNQDRDYSFTPDDYEQARINHSIVHSALMSGNNNPFYNQKHTPESLKKMSAARKGKSYEEIYGIDRAAELKLLRRKEQLGRKKGKQEIVTCKHCGTQGGIGIMNRWHGNNCKLSRSH